MADYPTIRGLRVKYLSADPSTATEGEVWYNSTSGTLKATVLSTAAWASGGAVTTARYGSAAAGTQTAGLIAGGSLVVNNSEEYNGTGWTEGSNLNTARMYVMGSGTQTSALASCGDQYPSPRFSDLTEEYNGASWSVQNTAPVATKDGGSCGTQGATLIFGGQASPGDTNATHLYDGTNWTNTGNNLNTARKSLRGAGTSTAALAVGGPPSTSTATEEYNGSSWTSVTASPSAFGAQSSAGTQTAALMFAGFTAPGGASTTTRSYDGTNWASAPNLGTGRYFANLGPLGTAAAALLASGNTGSVTPATEEFSGAVAETQTLTTS